MKYCFFGTPQFSAIILERLINAGFIPSLVITNPDRPVGRKGVITAPPVKVLAEKHNIPVLQLESLSDSKFEIQNSRLDYAVLASYGKVIPKEVIDAFPKGIIVVHPSLLPRYRGATPIQSALLTGDGETGTTLILMDEKMDHGPVLAKSKCQMPNAKVTYAELHDKLAGLSAELLIETLPKFLSGEITPVPQDEARATQTKKFSADDAFVPEAELLEAQSAGGKGAVAIDRKIRALNPEPGVWTLQNGKRVKLLEAEIADGKLKLKKIQKEGGMPVRV